MSNVIINFDELKKVFADYFSESFIQDLIESMEMHDVILQPVEENALFSWVSVDNGLPSDGDVYEVTAVPFSGSGSEFREFAYYDSVTKSWRSHFSGTLLHVLAWKPHTELFTVPFF